LRGETTSGKKNRNGREGKEGGITFIGRKKVHPDLNLTCCRGGRKKEKGRGLFPLRAGRRVEREPLFPVVDYVKAA